MSTLTQPMAFRPRFDGPVATKLRLPHTPDSKSAVGNTLFPACFGGFGAIMPKEAAIFYPYERAARQAAAMRAGNHAPKEREA